MKAPLAIDAACRSEEACIAFGGGIQYWGL